MINKKLLLTRFITALEKTHQNAIVAATRAHETATDDENIAENKYDTLAVEAAYLAHGQSVRAEQCANDITAFRALNMSRRYTKVSPGALVLLLDQQDNERWLFFGPSAGGMKLLFEAKNIVVVTADSPLGNALEQAQVGQEVSLHIANQQVHYEVVEIH